MRRLSVWISRRLGWVPRWKPKSATSAAQPSRPASVLFYTTPGILDLSKMLFPEGRLHLRREHKAPFRSIWECRWQWLSQSAPPTALWPILLCKLRAPRSDAPRRCICVPWAKPGNEKETQKERIDLVICAPNRFSGFTPTEEKVTKCQLFVTYKIVATEKGVGDLLFCNCGCFTAANLRM